MIYELESVALKPGAGAWVAPDADKIGKVALEVCVLHAGVRNPLVIGPNCTNGHKAMLHGRSVGKASLVGIVGDDAERCTGWSGMSVRCAGADHGRQGNTGGLSGHQRAG